MLTSVERLRSNIKYPERIDEIVNDIYKDIDENYVLLPRDDRLDLVETGKVYIGNDGKPFECASIAIMPDGRFLLYSPDSDEFPRSYSADETVKVYEDTDEKIMHCVELLVSNLSNLANTDDLTDDVFIEFQYNIKKLLQRQKIFDEFEISSRLSAYYESRDD